MRRLFLSLFILLVSSALSFVVAAESKDMTVWYFFSSDCPPCKKIEPIVKDLSKEFKMQGRVYGQGGTEPLPFEVRTGDVEASKRYEIESFPALVVLMNGNVKQVFRGERDIEDAKLFLYAFRKGAFSVSESITQGQQKIFTITGWIIAKGEYFKKAQFGISDRMTDLPIKAGLPLEAMKSPFRDKTPGRRPRLMSDVIRKPVVLIGSIKKTEEGIVFQVKEEIRID